MPSLPALLTSSVTVDPGASLFRVLITFSGFFGWPISPVYGATVNVTSGRSPLPHLTMDDPNTSSVSQSLATCVLTFRAGNVSTTGGFSLRCGFGANVPPLEWQLAWPPRRNPVAPPGGRRREDSEEECGVTHHAARQRAWPMRLRGGNTSVQLEASHSNVWSRR